MRLDRYRTSNETYVLFNCLEKKPCFRHQPLFPDFDMSRHISNAFQPLVHAEE